MRDISPSAALEELRAGGNAAEPSWRVWGILVSIVSIPLVVAEIMTTFGEPRIGLILYSVLLIVLLAHATLRWEFPIRSLLLSLTLIPLIRIISLTLPLNEFAPIFGYFLTGVPLFVATALIVRTLHWTWQEVGVAMGQLRLQALVAISGLVFG